MGSRCQLRARTGHQGGWRLDVLQRVRSLERRDRQLVGGLAGYGPALLAAVLILESQEERAKARSFLLGKARALFEALSDDVDEQGRQVGSRHGQAIGGLPG